MFKPAKFHYFNSAEFKVEYEKSFITLGPVAKIDGRQGFLGQGSYGIREFLCCSMSFIYE